MQNTNTKGFKTKRLALALSRRMTTDPRAVAFIVGDAVLYLAAGEPMIGRDGRVTLYYHGKHGTCYITDRTSNSPVLMEMPFTQTKGKTS